MYNTDCPFHCPTSADLRLAIIATALSQPELATGMMAGWVMSWASGWPAVGRWACQAGEAY
jgi:hypothetical protein